MKQFIYIAMLLVFGLADGKAQEQKEEQASIKSLVESQRYVFLAENAIPLRGRSIFLSPGYTLSVTPDTIISSLPYYGRAYQAPMSPNDAGIKFTSTDFTYTVKEKKGRWEVFVKVKDAGASQLNLGIGTDGSASLRVTSMDKQSISFQGRISKPTDE